MHDCEQLCERGPTKGPGDPRRRAACRCALPDFDTALWSTQPADEEAELLATDIGVAIASRHEESGHDLDTEGCPMSWVLSPFAQSILPFLGSRDWEGHRQRSPLLERAMHGEDDPELLWSMVQYYEAHEDGAFGLGKRLLDG
jgi:hypothetical protein